VRVEAMAFKDSFVYEDFFVRKRSGKTQPLQQDPARNKRKIEALQKMKAKTTT
jgi:hypothetical protein